MGGNGGFSEESLREFGRAIMAVSQGRCLSRGEAKELYRQILLGEQPEFAQGAFLAAHMARGPSPAEIAGAWEAQMDYDVETIAPELPEASADIVGTGSDALKTINVSSGAAVVAAAAGAYVAKKGARAATGVSGASDIFEAFGVDLEADLARAAESLKAHRLCYLPGEKWLRAGWGRLIRYLRFTSIFNLACPLLMPCRTTKHLVIGAFSAPLARQLVEICREIGMEAALGVYGRSDAHPPEEGMDEISVCGTTRVVELRHGTITEYDLRPDDLGLPLRPFAEIAAEPDVRENARALLAVLRGRADGARAEVLAANAGAVLYLLGRAGSWPQAVGQAREALATGRALEVLRGVVAVQQRRAGAGLPRLEEMLREA